MDVAIDHELGKETPIHHKKDIRTQFISFVTSHAFLFPFLIFVLAFIVRAHLMRYELFFEFDSYWHARMVSYILQGLPAPMVDPLAYYQNVAAATIGNPPILFWYISAAFYKIFTLNAPYNFELWVLFVKILPALYGALISVAMYFLGKELFKGPHEKMAGLFTGILAAVVPSFVYRTMGGFFEDDSFGFLGMVIGFVFFARAVRNPSWKRENILNAMLGGLGFALMVFTWSGYNMLVPILLGVGFMQFLIWLNEGEHQKAKWYAGLWLTSFLLFAAAATLQSGLFWLDQFGGILGIILKNPTLRYADTILFILFLWVSAAGLWLARTRTEWGPKLVKWVFILGILGLVLSPLLVTAFNFSLRTGDVLGQTVGEESEGKNYFGNKYSVLFVYALVGIPLMGYLLLRKSKHYEFLVLPLVWLILIFFMAWGKLKFTYYWGLPLALTGAIVLTLGWRKLETLSSSKQKMGLVIVSFFLLASIAAGIVFVTQNVPNIESSPGWKEAMFWANQNLDENTKFFNWWDEGHWISFLTNRKVLIDNRNADTKATSEAARFLLADDINTSVELFEKNGSTHLFFGDDLLSKLSNLGFFAYDITSINDPRIQGVFGVMMPCAQQVSPLTREINYECGGNQFSAQDMVAFPTTWSATPNNQQNGQPFFIYREEDNSRVYAFTSGGNQTYLARLWLGEPTVATQFTEIYRNTGGVRIYERTTQS